MGCAPTARPLAESALVTRPHVLLVSPMPLCLCGTKTTASRSASAASPISSIHRTGLVIPVPLNAPTACLSRTAQLAPQVSSSSAFNALGLAPIPPSPTTPPESVSPAQLTAALLVNWMELTPSVRLARFPSFSMLLIATRLAQFGPTLSAHIFRECCRAGSAWTARAIARRASTPPTVLLAWTRPCSTEAYAMILVLLPLSRTDCCARSAPPLALRVCRRVIATPASLGTRWKMGSLVCSTASEGSPTTRSATPVG